VLRRQKQALLKSGIAVAFVRSTDRSRTRLISLEVVSEPSAADATNEQGRRYASDASGESSDPGSERVRTADQPPGGPDTKEAEASDEVSGSQPVDNAGDTAAAAGSDGSDTLFDRRESSYYGPYQRGSDVP
jgi:hypothetical protein